MGWPESIAIIGIAFAVAWVFVALIKGMKG